MIRLPWFVCIAVAAHSASIAGDPRPALLPGSAYPIEVVVSEPAARFHWLDSLAGVEWAGGSAGKTIEAHRAEYVRLFGAPTGSDLDHLRSFAGVRVRFAEARYREWSESGEAEFSELLAAFLEAPDETSARERAARLIDDDDLDALTAALDHFRPHYHRIWQNGDWAEPFLRDARHGRDGRRLAAMLSRLADFYGIDKDSGPVPRVVLVPVPGGRGTHASARGRTLLIELRPEDRLAEAASVLAHENAHFLFERMAPERRGHLEQIFEEHDEHGRAAWDALQEALPTAIGQGVFDRVFRGRSWSPRHPWYHIDQIDAYAKEIYPLVERSFRKGRRLDGDLARALRDARPGRTDRDVTPRSP